MLPNQSAMRPARRLLLVEDEPLVQDLIVIVLEEAGFSIAVANDGLQAIELIEGEDELFCGLITDINLGPGADGWEVARKARARADDLPVIYVSGASCHEWASKGVPNSLMMTKPFDPAQFVVSILSLVVAATDAEP